ncbi:MAG: hypothetical protein K0R05_2628 [Anaerocolumna sp.]|jgi:hypothetical protein|nr:hypothetical protein [Anaerocolumna sp.]
MRILHSFQVLLCEEVSVAESSCAVILFVICDLDLKFQIKYLHLYYKIFILKFKYILYKNINYSHDI